MMDLKRLKIRYSTNIISGLFVVTVFFLSGTGAIGIPPSYARKIIVEIIIPIISNNGDNNIIEVFSKTSELPERITKFNQFSYFR